MRAGRNRGRASRKRAIALAAVICLGVSSGLAVVAQSAADDPAAGGASAGQPVVPADQVPAGFNTGASVSSPDVEIAAGPTGTVDAPDATFAFSSSSAALECSLDGGDFVTCSSPVTYSGLQNGGHLFAVRPVSADASGVSAQRAWTVQNLMSCTGANQPANFPVYSLGQRVAGLDLASTARRCEDNPEPTAVTRANYVSYTYGTCPELEDGTATGCMSPLEIQTWPGCERTLADYEVTPGEPYPHKALGTLDGVPAYSFNDGTRVELYAGTATIVIFASDPDLIDQAVANIQREPSSQPPGAPTNSGADHELPDPVAGAMGGELPCT